MLCRGGILKPWILKPDGDPTWTTEDWARAATLEARFSAAGATEEERRKYIPCAVYMLKFPGTTYDIVTMKRLNTLLCSL